MKKILTIFLLSILIPLGLFAGNLFEFSLGTTTAYQKANAIEEISKGNFNISDVTIEDFKFGADTNINLIFLNLNGKSFFTTSGDQFGINGIVSINLLLNFSIIRVKVGLGYQYIVDPKTLTVGLGSVFHVENPKDFTNANFDLYAGVDIVLGKVLLGAYATLPTNTTITKGNWRDLIDTVAENWKAAQVGISLSYAFL